MSQRQIRINPALKTATWEDIKAKRNELELSPITTTKGTFDADRDSLMRIDTAVAAFNSLPTLINGQLGWKTFDNQVVFLTNAELNEIRTAIAVRAATLHYQAGVIATGTHQVKDLDALPLWGL